MCYLSQPTEMVPEKKDSPQHTAVPPTVTAQKQYVASMYYPMPTVGEKQKSPEKKKPRKKNPEPVEQEEKKKKKASRMGQVSKCYEMCNFRSTVVVAIDRLLLVRFECFRVEILIGFFSGPSFRPQLTPEDLECIRRSVQQRNER